MTIKELIAKLSNFPDDMTVRYLCSDLVLDERSYKYISDDNIVGIDNVIVHPKDMTCLVLV